MSDGGRQLPCIDDTSMGQQTPGGSMLLDAQTLPRPHPATAAVPSVRQQYIVEEEITVSVPLVRPKQDFLFILRQAGARGEVFTRKEICCFLKNYIGSRKLYDPNDPRVVYCKEDRLGRVFGVDHFTINDVLCLLSKNCTPVPDTCIKRKRHVVSRSVSTGSQTTSPLDQKAAPPQAAAGALPPAGTNGPSSDVITSTTLRNTGGSLLDIETSQSRIDETCYDSVDGDPPVKTRKTSLSVTYSDSEAGAYPWYFSIKMEKSDESEILSVQDKETVLVRDSSDDLWLVEDDAISVQYESDAFSVEYEVESSPSDVISDTDGVSDTPGEDLLVVCNDSDVPFWASSEMDSESDSELSDGDKWICGECEEKNSPVQRYCSRCWKLRPDWLPEFHPQKQTAASSSRKKCMRSHTAPDAISSAESSASDSPRNNQSPVTDRSLYMSQRLVKKGSYWDSTSSSQPSSCSSSYVCNDTNKKTFSSPNKSCLSLSSDLRKGLQDGKCLSLLASCNKTVSDETCVHLSEHKKIFNDEKCLSTSSDSKNTLSYDTCLEVSTDSKKIISDETDLMVSDSEKPQPGAKCLLVSSYSNKTFPEEVCLSDSLESKKTLSDSKKTPSSKKGILLSDSKETLPEETCHSVSKELRNLCTMPNNSTSADVKKYLQDSGISVESGSPLLLSSQESQRSVSVMVSSQESQLFPDSKNPVENVHSVRLPHTSANINFMENIHSVCHSDTSDKNPPSKNSMTNSNKTLLLQMDTKLDDIISSTDTFKTSPRHCMHSSPKKSSQNTGQASASDMCMICLSRPKTASIIHGSSGHQVCCYQCAKRLKRKGRCCPVCRRSIQKVVRNFIL